VVAGAISLAGGGSEAGAATSPGQGSSSAQAIAVQPHEGALAVGAVMGEALAGHTQDYARAQSQGLDLGSVGLSLKGYDCSNLTPAQGGPVAPNPAVANSVPEPLEVETPSNGGQAEQTIGPQQGYDLNDAGNSTPDPSQAPPPPTYGWAETVLANAVPYAEADTTLADAVNAGLVSVSDVTSKAWSGLVNGQREAGATVDIGSLHFGTGLASVTLDGLQWNALYPSGGTAQPSATFTLGKLVVGGVAVPTSMSSAALQNLVNLALAPLGMEIQFPTVSTNANASSITLTPLELEVVPSTTRDSLLNSALAPLGPTTNSIFLDLENGFPGEPNSLLDVLCRSDSAITVLDIALASVTGGGYASASFGGVTASSSDLAANPYQLSTAAFPGLSPSQTEYIPGSAGTSSGGVSSVGAAPGTSPSAPASSPEAPTLPPSAAPPPAAGSESGGTAATVQPAAAGFAPGGPLLAIGLAGLGLVALMAEGDRRMMRRAQRRATFED
jgi:hypothetical protein